MWPVLGHEAITRLQQQPISATSTISNQDESRTMRSAETQTELLECSSSSSSSSSGGGVEEVEHVGGGASSEDAGSCVIEDDDDALDRKDDVEDDDDEYSLGEECKLKSIKRLHCTNLFNFNKLELLNERCSGGVGPQKLQQQISDSSRNLCEHEVHVAIDDDLTKATAGEGKRTLTAMMARTTAATVLGGDDSGSGSVIFIQESPEVIL